VRKEQATAHLVAAALSLQRAREQRRGVLVQQRAARAFV
jgi:hypothetical protein